MLKMPQMQCRFYLALRAPEQLGAWVESMGHWIASWHVCSTRGRWAGRAARMAVAAAVLWSQGTANGAGASPAGMPSLKIEAQYGDTFLRHDASVWSVDFSPDGTLLATADEDGKVSLWDLRNHRKVRDIVVKQGAAVYCVRFAPGDTLLTSSAPPFGLDCDTPETAPEISLWNLADGRLVRKFDTPTYKCHFLRLFDQGRKVIGGGQWGGGGDISVWDMESGKRVRTFQGDMARVHSLAVSPDESLVVTGDQNSHENSARLWDMKEGKVLHAFPKAAANSTVWTVAFSPDGRCLAYPTPDDKGVMVWHIAKQTGSSFPVLNAGDLNGMLFARDSRSLYCSGLDGIIMKIDLATGKTIAATRRLGSLVDLTMSPDGRWLAAGSFDHAAWVVDAEKMEVNTLNRQSLDMPVGASVPRNVQNPRVAVRAIGQVMMVDARELAAPVVITNACLRDIGNLAQSDEFIVGASYEGKAWTLDSRSGKLVAEFHVPKGSVLVSMADGSFGAVSRAQLWRIDPRTGQVRGRRIFAQETKDSPVLTHSPGGAYVTRRTTAETVELWDLQTTSRVLTAHAHGTAAHYDLSILSGDRQHYVVVVLTGENRLESQYFRIKQGVAEPPGPAAKLVAALGHASAAARDRAQRDLLELGPGALPVLQGALTNDEPEVKTRAAEIIAAWKEKHGAGVQADDVCAWAAYGKATGAGFFPDSARWFLSTTDKILLLEADGKAGAVRSLASLPLPKPALQLHLVGTNQFVAINCDTTVTLYRLAW